MKGERLKGRRVNGGAAGRRRVTGERVEPGFVWNEHPASQGDAPFTRAAPPRPVHPTTGAEIRLGAMIPSAGTTPFPALFRRFLSSAWRSWCSLALLVVSGHGMESLPHA